MTTLTALPGLTTGTWTIDPAHSEISFVVRHLMTKVRGSFTEFEGAIEIADDVTASTATATIQAASVNTRNEMRDGHLRSSDFFGVEDDPTISFATTGVQVKGDGYVLVGGLTIKGVTRPVELDVEFLGVEVDQNGVTKAGFEASTTINRKEFGVETNVTLNGDKLMLGDRIAVELSIQASPATPAS